jgi:ACR3 family arsenite transporter
MSDKVYNVLFVCTHNSARSIMAEGILNSLGRGRFRAFSAGSHPGTSVNPFALKTLPRCASHRWLPQQGLGRVRPARRARLDFVFTVCDKAAGEVCPVWPGQPMTAHWGVADPAAFEGTDEQKTKAFWDTAVILKRRIELMLALPLASLDKMASSARSGTSARDSAMSSSTLPVPVTAPAPMSIFERWLTVWVFLCIVAGIALGQMAARAVPGHRPHGDSPGQPAGGAADLGDDHPDAAEGRLRRAASGEAALARHRRHAVRQLGGQAVLDGAAGLDLHPPCVRALAARRPADSYIAGLILLAAAPCTAMVFVWSRLTNGHPLFTLSQVALNDTIMVFAFAPIVALLLGLSSIVVPWDTLLTSVVLYIVIPVVIAQLWRALLAPRAQAPGRRAGRIGPWSIVALLATLVLLFAFQGEAILKQPLVIAMLAVPILIQVFFNCRRWPTG